MRLVLDIEGNGLLPEVTEIHCLVIQDVDTGEVSRWHEDPALERDGNLAEGLEYLEQADTLIGHNLQGYDIPALAKVLGWEKPPHIKVYDTLVAVRVAHPRVGSLDKKSYPDIPTKSGDDPGLWGRHSLAAWGYRMSCPKDDYDGGWEELSQEMLDYCVQDVATNVAVYRYLVDQELPPLALEIEHPFASHIGAMMNRGWPFDVAAAEELAEKLEVRYAELTDTLMNLHSGWEDEYVTKVRKERKTRWTPFNPASRHHLTRLLKERYDWKPKVFTKTGLAKVDETTLLALGWPEAVAAGERFAIQKLLGRLVSSPKEKAWLQVVQPDGRVYGYQNHNGTVTGRCSHQIIANVPKKGEFGSGCRRCFTASKGRVMVGADASGIDIRMLSHYVGFYDGGALATEVETGDVHARNFQALKFCPNINKRDDAKGPLYALMYGAGDAKLGALGGGSRVLGKQVRRALYKTLGGLEKLVSALEAAYKKNGFYKGLDGRRIHPDGKTTVLNYLLQGAAAIVMKLATNLLMDRMDHSRADLLGHQHDEFQLDSDPDYAEELGQLAVQCIADAGEQLNLRVKLGGEYKTGANWAETH